MQQIFEDVILTKRPISLNKTYFNKILKPMKPSLEMDFKDESSFWVQLITRDENGQVEKTGKVRVQIDVYPKKLAEMNKVGEARNEPNVNPFLPPPIGRLSFSLNPLKMFVSIFCLILTLCFIVIIGWSRHEKKDLLLLLSCSNVGTMYYDVTNDYQQFVCFTYYSTF